MECLLLYLLVIYYVIAISGSKGNPDPSRLKKMRDKIRRETSIRNVKERIINNDKNILRSSPHLDKDSENVNILNSNGNLIELFVRRIDDKIASGPWFGFQQLPMSILDEGIDQNDIVGSLLNGGIESELIRPKVDNLVSLKVYGKGLGEPLVLDKIKATLPQFKKLKGKQFQFGYKISLIDTFISSIDRNMNNLQSTISSRNSFEEPIKAMNITSILEVSNPKELTIEEIIQSQRNLERPITESIPLPLEQLVHRVDLLLEQLSILKSSTVLISVDGSAVFNGANCIDGAAGVFAIPIAPRSQITLSNMNVVTTINPSLLSTSLQASTDENIIIEEDDHNMTMIPPVTSVGVVSEGLEDSKPLPRSFSSTHIGSELFAGNMSNAIYLRVSDFRGMITTPFDAEISAGLAGFTLANLIYKRSKLLQSSSIDQSLKFQIVTDSRSFLRSLRKDLDSVDLMYPSMVNRLAMRTCVMKHYEELCNANNADSIATTNNNSVATNEDNNCILKTDWTSGHPERRDLLVETWSVRDKAIWIADELAKSKSESEILTNSRLVSNHIAEKLQTIDGLYTDNQFVIELQAMDLLLVSKVLLK